MKDFTLKMYHRLLGYLKGAGYHFYTFENYLTAANRSEKLVILRHDVDLRPENALKMAQLEQKFGVRASYYFRIVKSSYDERLIGGIVDLGHEIGYHYEDLTLTRGDFQEAIQRFDRNLQRLRSFYPIKTICMHGSPLSRFDNRKIWTKYDYRDFGIIGEPYFDVDFRRVMYLTDTGRRWDGGAMNVRDKIESPFPQRFHHTLDIIQAVRTVSLSQKMMISVHPQRWTDSWLPWVVELICQNTKNMLKKFLAK
jgi:hypothetical protein